MIFCFMKRVYFFPVKNGRLAVACLWLMKQQFVVMLAMRQTGIHALPDSWFTNTPSVKILYPQEKIAVPYIFVKSRCAKM
jgi:hypothetical protein